jgi:hypothetical protein
LSHEDGLDDADKTHDVGFFEGHLFTGFGGADFQQLFDDVVDVDFGLLGKVGIF